MYVIIFDQNFATPQFYPVSLWNKRSMNVVFKEGAS